MVWNMYNLSYFFTSIKLTVKLWVWELREQKPLPCRESRCWQCSEALSSRELAWKMRGRSSCSELSASSSRFVRSPSPIWTSIPEIILYLISCILAYIRVSQRGAIFVSWGERNFDIFGDELILLDILEWQMKSKKKRS